MFPAASLFAILLLTISIAASPVEVRSPHATLSFAKRINTSGGATNLLQHDRARATALKEHGIRSGKLEGRDFDSTDVSNTGVSYIASVGVGNPATDYNLIIDTGSSNTWLGADTRYKPTIGSICTGKLVSERYGTTGKAGYFIGTEWLDTVTLGSDLVITQQSIGVASLFGHINPGVDGILGIGPEGLTEGSLVDEPFALIPTVTQNLYAQKTIPAQIVSISFAPTTTAGNINGELTFGGVDASKYTGSLSYIPITSTPPASSYWGMTESVAYGGVTILSETAGIVDSGTTLILLASEAFSAYQSATGGTLDSTTNLLSLTPSQYNNLQNLSFNIGSETYTVIPNGQIWPRTLNTYIGGSSSAIYSIVGDLGTPFGSGLDFINGQSFLERFYSVFDTTNQQIGFATTSYTDTTTN